MGDDDATGEGAVDLEGSEEGVGDGDEAGDRSGEIV